MANKLFAYLDFLLSMQLFSISLLRFIFLLNMVAGYSWNNPWSVLLLASIFQCFETVLLVLGKNGYMLTLSGVIYGVLLSVSLSCVFNSRCSFIFAVFNFWELMIDRFFVVILIYESFFIFSQVIFKVRCFQINYFIYYGFGILFFKNLGCYELMLMNALQSVFCFCILFYINCYY